MAHTKRLIPEFAFSASPNSEKMSHEMKKKNKIESFRI
jgi:hypothetical protein